MKTTLRQSDKTSKRRKAWSRNANAKRIRNIAERHALSMTRIEAEIAEDQKCHSQPTNLIT